MEPSEVALRTYHTGYRSTFKFRVSSKEQPDLLVKDFIQNWLMRLAPDSPQAANWDGVSELVLPRGVYVQGLLDEDMRAAAFRIYLPESAALQDSGDNPNVGVPGEARGRDKGAKQRYHRSTFYVSPTTLHDRPAARVLIQGATDDNSIVEAIDEYEIPSVVGDILLRRTCFDGDTRLLGTPEIIDRRAIKRALDAVLDPERMIAVIVASSPATQGDDAFLEVTRSLLRRCVGTATGYVLQASAVDTFNDRLPPHLRVPRGDVRTFLPHADVEDPLPGQRHRYVGPEKLARSLNDNRQVEGILPTLHARLPRRQMLEHPLDAELLSLRTQMDRQARRGRIPSVARLLRRERESAERGLGPHGTASFDDTLLLESAASVGGTLHPEPTTDLEKFLIESEESVAPSVDVPVENTETEEANVVVAPEPEPALPRTRVVDRPLLDQSVTGPKRVVSFLRRWLYPHGHKEVIEETVDAKIVEADGVFASKEDEHEAALELLDGAEKEMEDLYTALSDSARDLADARAEAALAQEEANEHSAKLAFYRKELIEARRFDALGKQTDDVDEWSVPHDLHEIAAILTDDPRGKQVRDFVVFTGDLAQLDAVAQRDSHGQYASATWSFIHALYDFVQLRRKDVNISVDMYLRHDALEGHKVSVRRHAFHESDTVRNREELRRLREFPVPTSVNASGKVFMESHFRIGSGDGFSPRMYYLDNTSEDGKVYVGYIGRHPKNLLTN